MQATLVMSTLALESSCAHMTTSTSPHPLHQTRVAPSLVSCATPCPLSSMPALLTDCSGETTPLCHACRHSLAHVLLLLPPTYITVTTTRAQCTRHGPPCPAACLLPLVPINPHMRLLLTSRSSPLTDGRNDGRERERDVDRVGRSK